MRQYYTPSRNDGGDETTDPNIETRLQSGMYVDFHVCARRRLQETMSALERNLIAMDPNFIGKHFCKDDTCVLCSFVL